MIDVGSLVEIIDATEHRYLDFISVGDTGEVTSVLSNGHVMVRLDRFECEVEVDKSQLKLLEV